MSGLGLFRLHQPGLRWILLFVITMVFAKMMINNIFFSGIPVHQMMSLATLPRPQDQTHTGLKGLSFSSLSSLILIFLLYRALFGPTDHEENLRFVRKELKKAKNEAANKW